MGASSSSASSTSLEIQEQESLAASTASLPNLRSAFASLSYESPVSSLSQILSLNRTPKIPVNTNLAILLSNLGPAISSILFPSASSSQQFSWLKFLTGYNACCSRIPASASVNLLFRVFAESCTLSGIPCKLDLESDPEKMGGTFSSLDLEFLLSVCWIMEWSWRVGNRKHCGGKEGPVPDLRHLVLSAMGMEGEEEGVERIVSVQQVQMWVISCVPGLAGCLSRYVQDRFKTYATDSGGSSSEVRKKLRSFFCHLLLNIARVVRKPQVISK